MHEQVVVNIDSRVRIKSEVHSLKLVVQIHNKVQRKTVEQHVGDVVGYQNN